MIQACIMKIYVKIPYLFFLQKLQTIQVFTDFNRLKLQMFF